MLWGPGSWVFGAHSELGYQSFDCWATPTLQPWKDDFLSTSVKELPMGILGASQRSASQVRPIRNVPRDIPSSSYR